MTKFYDAADWSKIPSDATHAALYADGKYAVPSGASVRHIPHRRWITITGNSAAVGIADYEHGNPVYDEPGKLREWAIRHLTHHLVIPIVYCDRANLRAAMTELGRLPRRWWIPTLDNHEWTAIELGTDIEVHYGVNIPASEIWANQYTDHSNEYDVSNLFGHWFA